MWCIPGWFFLIKLFLIITVFRASALSSAVSTLANTGMSFSRMDEKEKQQALEEEQARLQALKVLYFLQVCILRFFLTGTGENQDWLKIVYGEGTLILREAKAWFCRMQVWWLPICGDPSTRSMIWIADSWYKSFIFFLTRDCYLSQRVPKWVYNISRLHFSSWTYGIAIVRLMIGRRGIIFPPMMYGMWL